MARFAWWNLNAAAGIESVMSPLNKDHVVHGPFTLKDVKLTFRTGGGRLAYDAMIAKSAGRDFTVTLTPPGEDVKEVTGRVQTVELVPGAARLEWEIVIIVGNN